MPEAPRSKQHARNFSTGSEADVFALAILAFSSRFSLAVAAMLLVSRVPHRRFNETRPATTATDQQQLALLTLAL